MSRKHRGFVISPWLLAIAAGAYGWHAQGWLAGVATLVLFVAAVIAANYAYLHWCRAPGKPFFKHIRLIKWAVFAVTVAAIQVTST